MYAIAEEYANRLLGMRGFTSDKVNTYEQKMLRDEIAMHGSPYIAEPPQSDAVMTTPNVTALKKTTSPSPVTNPVKLPVPDSRMAKLGRDEVRLHGHEFYLDNEDSAKAEELMLGGDYEGAANVLYTGAESGKYSMDIAGATYSKLVTQSSQKNLDADSAKATELLANGDYDGALGIFRDGINTGRYTYEAASAKYESIAGAQAEKDRIAARPYTVHERNMHDRDEKDEKLAGTLEDYMLSCDTERMYEYLNTEIQSGRISPRKAQINLDYAFRRENEAFLNEELITTLEAYMFNGDTEGMQEYLNTEIQSGRISPKHAQVNLNYAYKEAGAYSSRATELNDTNKASSDAVAAQEDVVDDALKAWHSAEDEYARYIMYNNCTAGSKEEAEALRLLDVADAAKVKYESEKDKLAAMKGDMRITSADEYARFAIDVDASIIDARISALENPYVEGLKEYEDALKRGDYEEAGRIAKENPQVVFLQQGITPGTEAQREQKQNELYYLYGFKTFAGLSEEEKQAILQYVAMGADKRVSPVITQESIENLPTDINFLTWEEAKYYTPGSKTYVDFYGQTRNSKKDWNNIYDIIGAVYGSMSEEDFKRMITTLGSIQNAKDEAKNYASAIEFANDHPIIATIASIPGGLLGSIPSAAGEFGRMVVNSEKDYGYRKPYDVNASWHSLSNRTEATTGHISGDVERKYGSGAAFAYNTGISFGQNLAAGLTPLGPAVLGASAWSSTYRDAKARGISDAAACDTANAAATFEFIFESISIGNFKIFKDIPATDFNAIMRNIAASTVVNLSEEVFTEGANIIFDYCKNKDLSQYGINYQKYIDSGMSPAAAKAELQNDFFRDLSEAGFSGALMGPFFTGTKSTADYLANSTKYATYGSAYLNANGSINTGLSEWLIDAALKSSNSKAKAYAKTLTKGNLDPNKLGALHWMYFYSDSGTAQTKTAPKQTKVARSGDFGGVSSEVSRAGDTVTLANERDDNVIFADTSTSEGESNDLITTSSAVDSGETSGYNISRPLHLDTAEGISKRLVSEGLTVEKADRAAYVLESMLMGEAPTQAELDVIMSSKQAFDMFREYFGTDVDLTASDALEHVTQRVAERNGGRNPIVNRLYTNENLLTNGRLDFNKILIEFMDSDIAPSKYRDAMNVYYEAGKNGKSFESVYTSVALSDKQKHAAYTAGVTAKGLGLKDTTVLEGGATEIEVGHAEHNRYKEVLCELVPDDFDSFTAIRQDSRTLDSLDDSYETVVRYEIVGDVPRAQVLELDNAAYTTKRTAFDPSGYTGNNKRDIIAFSKKGNAASMIVDGTVYFSHSKAALSDCLAYGSYRGEYPLIGLKSDRRFKVLDLGDGVNRIMDTEAKFLEYVADVKNPEDTFTVTILSEKHICLSCEGVVEQFKQMFPNATVNIISGKLGYNNDPEGKSTWADRK